MVKAGVNMTRANWYYVFGPETREELRNYLDWDEELIAPEPNEVVVGRSMQDREAFQEVEFRQMYAPLCWPRDRSTRNHWGLSRSPFQVISICVFRNRSTSVWSNTSP